MTLSHEWDAQHDVCNTAREWCATHLLFVDIQEGGTRCPIHGMVIVHYSATGGPVGRRRDESYQIEGHPGEIQDP